MLMTRPGMLSGADVTRGMSCRQADPVGIAAVASTFRSTAKGRLHVTLEQPNFIGAQTGSWSMYVAVATPRQGDVHSSH